MLGDPISNAASFRDEARYQGLCAVCGKPGPWDPHHVVAKQWLKKRGLPQWDTRNALRLCKIMGGRNNCHARHENAVRRVKTRELTPASIQYAFELMGPHGADYLRTYYDDGDPDPRIERELEAKITA